MQNKSTIHTILLALLMAAVTLTACQNDLVPYPTEETTTGRIVLNLSDVEVFVETRATGDVADYTYTLSGTDTEGQPVTDTPITFTDGSAIIPAGTYTLTATSKTTKDAAPWYQGTSEKFTLSVGGTTPVTINLGSPQNAKVSVTFTDSFKQLYENYSVTIGNHSTTTDGNLYAAPGPITYTIQGSAKAGSHVSDIPEAGITGTLTTEPGKSYPLTISATTISDLMIDIGEGTHSGAFDVKRQ